MIKIVIPGDPISKKRPKFFRRGSHVGAYSEQTTEEGRFLTLAIAQIGSRPSALFPPDVPVRLEANFYFRFPLSWSKKKVASNPPHISKPDVDNLLKFVKDALNGFVWSDDRQIVRVYGAKAYSEDPRTEIFISYPTAASPFNK